MISAKKIWRNGKLIDWEQATVHVMAHVLHYGSSVFEGIRCYKTARGPEVFRLHEHVVRLFNSCRIYRMDLPYSIDEFQEVVLSTIRANELDHCYIRPLIIRGVGPIGVNPLANPIDCFVIVWEWGKYLGDDALEQGVDVCVSTWSRAAANTFPTMAKAGGNYLNSQLVKMEAVINGFSEGIALDTQGYVSEGSGENVFVIREARIYTPPMSRAILPGITRDSIMRVARDLGLEVIEETIPREMLYLADEVFMTGTAAEVTPVRTIDRIVIGQGRRGPITARIQEAFFDYVEGRVPDRYGWLTRVHRAVEVDG